MLGVSLSDEDFAFSHVDGTPLLPDTVSHVWTETVKRAGLKHFRLHDGRHTHASLLLKQNVHPKIVQERLGHASISTTLDLYSHVVPGLQEAAARRFDEALSPEYN
jgi:integrase